MHRGHIAERLIRADDLRPMTFENMDSRRCPIQYDTYMRVAKPSKLETAFQPRI